MRQQHNPLAVAIIVASACVLAFFGSMKIADVHAQRVGYVERASDGAFANQLAPSPVASKMLVSLGTSNRVGWADQPTALPVGTPGEVPMVHANTVTSVITSTATQTATGTATAVTYTLTSTGTATAAGTSYKSAEQPFDDMGTYYLCGSGQEGPPTSPAWARWNEFANVDAFTASAACSTGSDGLIGTVYRIANNLQRPESRAVWNKGRWLAELKAKVNANGAAIRVEVWNSTDSSQWFNWTTDSFTNTSYTTITKPYTQTADIVPASAAYLYFKLYATCSTPTTVTVEFSSQSNGYATKLRSPNVALNLRSWDIQYWGVGYTVYDELFSIGNWQYNMENTVAGKEPTIPSGTPGKFVRYAGTGTSVTTSKEAAYPGLTSRSAFIQSKLFTIAVSGAASYDLSSFQVWILADGASQYVTGAFFVVPMDASGTSLTVRPVWRAGSTDASSHTVRWNVMYSVMANDTSANLTMTDTLFTGVSSAKTASAYYIETGSTITASAGDVVKLAVKRVGADAADTYVGDVHLIGLRIDYTSSI